MPNLILLILTVYRQVDRVKSSECPLHLYSAGRVSSGRAANTIEDKNLLKSLSPARVAELSNDS